MAKPEVSSLAEKPGFFYGYVIVLAAFGVQAVGWGLYYTFGVFFNQFLAEFHWSRAAISGAASLCSLLYGSSSIVMGSLNDRFGPRVVMAACGLLFGLGFLLMSKVDALWQLYLFYSVIVGIGLSDKEVVPLSTVARWFVKKRGTMSGIIKVGTGVGILAMPLVASRLISAYEWRTAYIILGAIGLVSIILLSQLLRRDPGQMSQLPDGDEEVRAGSLGLAERGWSLREAIYTRQFWTICAIYLTISFCVQMIMIHIAPHAVDLGVSLTGAAAIISIVGAVSIVGRLVMGRAGDRLGNKRALIICFIILIAALIWLQFAEELWMLYLFAIAYGFNHGGFFTLVSPTVAGLFGTRAHGAIFGVVIFSGTIGGAAGPFLAGRIFDVTTSYQLAFLIMTAFSIIGLILATSLRPISEGGGK